MSIDKLIKKIRGYCPDCNGEILHLAYERTAGLNGYGNGSSPSPSLQRLLGTAEILSDFELDLETIAASLLSPVPSNTKEEKERIRQDYGEGVVKLVEGSARLNRIAWGSLEEEKAENLRKMFLTMVDDVRVVMIKLADQLYTLRTFADFPTSRSEAAARETLAIFAPLANRLGIWKLKQELEDLAFKRLEPQRHLEIRARIQQNQKARQKRIEEIVQALNSELAKNGLRTEVRGRPKSVYGIAKKMEAKEKTFDEIYDIQAVRVLVDSVEECYSVLDVIHALWEPIPGEFDDYIAAPKNNMYRSLHTAVRGPGSQPLEIQIRTRLMDQISEFGVAAHWRYKEQKERDIGLESKIAGLRGLLEWKKELSEKPSALGPAGSVHFPEKIYVFTPQGDVLDLDKGSTPLDFAFRIHTRIGEGCRGAKVNGKLVPLNTILDNGDRVEIMIDKARGPSRDWLSSKAGYVHSARTREKIRQWFHRKDREENIGQGRQILERCLKRLNIRGVSFEDVAGLFLFESADPFLEEVGKGQISVHQIESRLRQSESDKPIPAEIEDRSSPSPFLTQVEVDGMGNLLTRLARCCNPLPGDAVIGYVTRGRGISIHRRNCPNIRRLSYRDALIEVDWGKNRQTFTVRIEIVGSNLKKILKPAADVVDDEKAVLSSCHSAADARETPACVHAAVEVRDIVQLKRILSRLKALPTVMEARRMLN